MTIEMTFRLVILKGFDTSSIEGLRNLEKLESFLQIKNKAFDKREKFIFIENEDPNNLNKVHLIRFLDDSTIHSITPYEITG